jgi:protein-tyrosine-phosphatase
VCLGNTARSPAAEYLARQQAKKLNVDLKFDSCGFINAFSYIQPESRKYLDSKGIDYTDFLPKIVSRNLLEKQDLILTMEKHHTIEIINTFNQIHDIEEKTLTLKEFNGETTHTDIIDPYYTSGETYMKVLKIIDENIEKAISKIIEVNKKGI